MNDTNRETPDFNVLLEKYLAGSISEEETGMMFSMLPDSEKELGDHLMEALHSGRFDGQTDAALRNRLFARLPIHRQRRFQINRWWQAAAAAVLITVAGTLIWTDRHAEVKQPQVAETVPVIPAGNKAVLILGNGNVIQLDSVANGTLAQQGGASVSKVHSGLLAYGANDPAAGGPVYHTIATPKGGTYAVVLPDGSKAWLNAASSIRFPTTFDNTRKVEVTGEAYFEITKHPGSRFEVLAKGTKVTVLGTKFNVKAYADEQSTRITLVEGSVRFAAGRDSSLLKPGEQAIAGDNQFRIAPADMEAVLAWRNGMFHFDDQPLADIMREIGRWYDVEVKYYGNTASRRFTGIMRRSGSIDDVLKFMQLAGISSVIENRTIIMKQ